ncbi:hypothetical protein F5880DRAFT_510346 [Lentinula raphanica]|nr:hypothetical protein F5880DRAFT_510346 [Lentinula raphanica]
MPMVSLPAGFYEIHFHTYDGTRKVPTPESVGVAIITGNLPKDAIWQMQADGRIVAFSKSGNQVQQYQTLTKNKPCQQGDSVTTSNEENSGMPWLICNVQYHLVGNYWTGDIMTNDGTKLSWSVDSADSSVRIHRILRFAKLYFFFQIRLRQVDDFCISSMPKFEFRPITTRDGQGKLPPLNLWDGKHPVVVIGRGFYLVLMILEVILTLVIIILYVILEMVRGNGAGILNDLLASRLARVAK